MRLENFVKPHSNELIAVWELHNLCQGTLSLEEFFRETENPCKGSQLFSQEQWSIHEGFPCARNELWLCLKGLVQSWKSPTFKEVRDMAKSEESADKQLQLMSTEVCSINVPKRYQCQGNQRPTSNTGSSKLQACRNCGWGTHPWEQCPVKNVTCHFCQN